MEDSNSTLAWSCKILEREGAIVSSRIDEERRVFSSLLRDRINNRISQTQTQTTDTQMSTRRIVSSAKGDMKRGRRLNKTTEKYRFRVDGQRETHI